MWSVVTLPLSPKMFNNGPKTDAHPYMYIKYKYNRTIFGSSIEISMVLGTRTPGTIKSM